MKKFVLMAAVAAAAVTASPAFAKSGNNGGGNGGCGVGQQTNGCGTPTPTPTPTPSPVYTGTNTQGQLQGQAQGQLQGQAQGQIANGGNATGGAGGAGGSVLASGNSANDIRNTNTANGGAGGNVLASGNSSNDIRNTNDVRNTNTNITGPSTSTSGAISGSLSNSTNDNSNSANNSSRNTADVDVNVEGDTYINKQRRIPVSTAYAPALTSGIDTCLGSLSGGAQTGVFGISFGGTKVDATCERIKLGREAAAMGMPDVQCHVLAQDPRFLKALEASGRSCALPASVSAAPAPLSSQNPVIRYENKPVVQPTPVNPVYGSK